MVDLQFQFLIVFKLNNLAQETFIHEPLYHKTIVMLVFILIDPTWKMLNY